MDEIKKKILIIEDEKPIAKAMMLKLTKEGFDVQVVGNGMLGFEKIKVESFDLVVCDLVMPEMDGFGLLTAVKESGIDVPVLILTNLSQDEDKEKVMALGAKGFFVKSDMSISDIVTHVNEFLRT